MAEKVLKLHGVSFDRGDFETTEVQIELFGQKLGRRPSWAMLRPEEFDQRSLISVLVRNRIDLVVDLRPKPIFPKPHYAHKEFMRFFVRSTIRYVDIAEMAHSSESQIALFFLELRRRMNTPSTEAAPLFTVCLMDNSAVDAGIVAQFRQIVRSYGDHVVELHPRALLS